MKKASRSISFLKRRRLEIVVGGIWRRGEKRGKFWEKFGGAQRSNRGKIKVVDRY